MLSEEDYQTKINELEEELRVLKEKLKSYTSPDRNKIFYKNHKDELKIKSKNYKNNLSSEKKKEYARRAYLNKKEKMNNQAIN